MLARLAVAALAATALIGILVAALAFLSYRDPGTPTMSGVDHRSVFTAWFSRRNSPRTDRELANGGMIVPVDEAREWLRSCSPSSVDLSEGYWQPATAMVLELEARLPAVMSSRLRPLHIYNGRYVGIVSGGRPLIYGSFVAERMIDNTFPRRVVDLPKECGKKFEAFSVTFDIEAKTFGELRTSGSR